MKTCHNRYQSRTGHVCLKRRVCNVDTELCWTQPITALKKASNHWSFNFSSYCTHSKTFSLLSIEFSIFTSISSAKGRNMRSAVRRILQNCHILVTCYTAIRRFTQLYAQVFLTTCASHSARSYVLQCIKSTSQQHMPALCHTIPHHMTHNLLVSL
jgi:hypothetical protein